MAEGRPLFALSPLEIHMIECHSVNPLHIQTLHFRYDQSTCEEVAEKSHVLMHSNEKTPTDHSHEREDDAQDSQVLQ